MHILSNTTGPVGYGEEPSKVRNSSTTSTRKATNQELIQELIIRANAVPIFHVFKYYKIRFDFYTEKTRCPFKDHKGGKENTASLKKYEDTNSFNCFGCGRGGGPVIFVSLIDGCSLEKAANKILHFFSNKIDDDFLVDNGINSSERLEIMMQLSTRIFQFRQEHNDKHAFEFIEYIAWVYDHSNALHNYDNEALRRLVNNCIEHIEIYNPQMALSPDKEYLKLICKS
jgi:hypothetical protein